MPRKDLTSDQAAFDRMETQKRELLADKLHLEAEKTGQPLDKDKLRGSLDDVLSGAHGAEKQKQFREALDANDTPGFKRVQQQVATQDAVGSIEAVTAAQDLGIKLDQIDAPRFARAVQQQITAGTHGRQAVANVAGSIGDGSMLLDSNATSDEISTAMSTRVSVDGSPDSLLEPKPSDYGKLSIRELDAQMVRESGSPAQQAHQAALDRAAAAATPAAKALREAGVGPPVDPTDYDALTVKELDELMMKESGQTDPRSGRYETSVPGVTVTVHD